MCFHDVLINSRLNVIFIFYSTPLANKIRIRILHNVVLCVGGGEMYGVVNLLKHVCHHIGIKNLSGGAWCLRLTS